LLSYKMTMINENPHTEISETSAPTDPALLVKTLKQVEFYFSDVNLPKDKFMMEQTKNSPDGWVSIATISSFSRMKALTADVSIVVEALRTSPELLEVNEEGTMVRRKRPLSASDRDAMKCSVYAKGFPIDATLEDLEVFFNGVAKVLAIRFRRHMKSKAFKGSVFVELESEAEAERVSKLDLEYKDVKLILFTKMDYFKNKHEEIQNRKSGKEMPEVAYTKGCLIKMSNVPKGIPYALIKTPLEEVSVVGFVETDESSSSGFVRLKEAKAAELVSKYHETGLTLEDHKDAPIQFSLPSEEEEKAYYENAFGAKQQNNKRKGNQRERRNPKHHSRKQADKQDAEDEEKEQQQLNGEDFSNDEEADE